MLMENTSHLLTPKRCCLLLIDPQEKLLAAVHEPQRLIKNTKLLIRCAQALEIPTLATSQYKKGLGPLVPEISDLLQGSTWPDKTQFNCFANDDFIKMINDLPDTVDTVIMAGAEAHICIYQTAMGAMDHNLNPWVVSDAVSSRDEKNIPLALHRLRQLGAAVGPTEMIIYELLQQADSAAFKKMLPFMK